MSDSEESDQDQDMDISSDINMEVEMEMEEGDSSETWAIDQVGVEDEDGEETSSEESNSDRHDRQAANFRFPDEFRLIPTAPPALQSEDASGPGPTTQAFPGSRFAPRELTLNDEDDTRYEVVHPSAGFIKNKRPSNAQAGGRLTSCEPEDNIFAPFASSIEWKIAEWAIKDSIGHNSLDRFLSIPGVSQMYYQ